MISQTETSGAAGQYGFYAVPKAVEPKKKYREQYEDQYEDQQAQDMNPYASIEDREAANQKELDRDYYVDEAPYPEFKPRERGLDYGVQIERGDLFDFDLQVKPLIEILVGRSVVTAINELQEEKEKDQRKSNLDKYQKKRNAQLMVTQRLEAKHKRKNEETDRRRLQKDVYVKNQRQAGKKLIARRNAKQALLGLKNDLFNELEDAGYLRSEAVSDLKIKYEEWLYEKIMESLHFNEVTMSAAKKIINEEDKRITEEHQNAINEEMKKRKIVLDQRARVDRENQEKKEKKRALKLRKKLNNQRQPDFIKFQQLMERYEQVNSVLKHGERSSGFSRDFADKQAVYIAGGLVNYLLALLESTGKQYSAEEIENMLIKIINESGKELEIDLLADSYDKLEQTRKRMQEKKSQFMAQKAGQVKDLAQHMCLDISLLQATNTPIRWSLIRNFIEALLSIYLTIQPEKVEENQVELTESDKKRLQYVDRLVINRQQQKFIQRVERVNDILRVHFEILHSNVNSEASQLNEEGKEPEKEQEEFIDIFDGQGWNRYSKTAKRELNRSEQAPAAINLGSFDNTFVYDERTMHYLQGELQKLLDVNGGEKFTQFCENLSNVRARVKKDLPVYDSEIRWG